MEIHERIAELRKELSLSRRAFGEKLGVSESVIVNIEHDRLKRPDQKEPIYRLICEKFGVDEIWLHTGVGDMFRKMSRNEEIASFVGNILSGEKDDFKFRLISVLSRLEGNEWEILERRLREILDTTKAESN